MFSRFFFSAFVLSFLLNTLALYAQDSHGLKNEQAIQELAKELQQRLSKMLDGDLPESFAKRIEETSKKLEMLLEDEKLKAFQDRLAERFEGIEEELGEISEILNEKFEEAGEDIFEIWDDVDDELFSELEVNFGDVLHDRFFDQLSWDQVFDSFDKTLKKPLTVSAIRPIAKPQQQEKPKWWLGLQIDIDDRNQINVTKVYENSPASRAGFRKGDKITAVNGVKVKDMEKVANAVIKSDGEFIKMKVQRGRESKIIAIKPIQRPSEEPKSSDETAPADEEDEPALPRTKNKNQAVNQAALKRAKANETKLRAELADTQKRLKNAEAALSKSDVKLKQAMAEQRVMEAELEKRAAEFSKRAADMKNKVANALEAKEKATNEIAQLTKLKSADSKKYQDEIAVLRSKLLVSEKQIAEAREAAEKSTKLAQQQKKMAEENRKILQDSKMRAKEMAKARAAMRNSEEQIKELQVKLRATEQVFSKKESEFKKRIADMERKAKELSKANNKTSKEKPKNEESEKEKSNSDKAATNPDALKKRIANKIRIRNDDAKNTEGKPKEIKVEVNKTKDGKSQITVWSDGKTYKVNDLRKLPKDIRNKVKVMEKKNNTEKRKSELKVEDKDGLKIEVNKENKDPAKIIISRNGKVRTYTEKNLNRLSKEIRERVQVMLNEIDEMTGEHGDHEHGDHEHGDHEHGDHEHGDHEHGDHEHGDHEHGDHEHGDHEHGDHEHGDHEHRDHDRDHEYKDHEHEELEHQRAEIREGIMKRRVELEKLVQRFGERHPRVRKTMEELRELEEKIHELEEHGHDEHHGEHDEEHGEHHELHEHARNIERAMGKHDAELRELREKFGERHPKVREVVERMKALEREHHEVHRAMEEREMDERREMERREEMEHRELMERREEMERREMMERRERMDRNEPEWDEIRERFQQWQRMRGPARGPSRGWQGGRPGFGQQRPQPQQPENDRRRPSRGERVINEQAETIERLQDELNELRERVNRLEKERGSRRRSGRE